MSTRTSPRTSDSRPERRTAGSDPASRGLVASGGVAAAWCAGVGLAVVAVLILLGWAVDPASAASVGDALRVAGLGWLLAQHAPLRVPGGSVSVAPLGLTLVSATLLARAGRVAAGRSIDSSAGPGRLAASGRDRPPGWTDGVRVTASVALPYAVIAGAVAALSDVGGTRAPVLSSAAVAGALAAVWVGSGFLLARRDRADGPDRSAAGWPVLLRGAAVAALTVVGTGAVLAGAALGWHHPRVAATLAALDPGTAGGSALLAASVLLVPNAAVWGASYATGTGFAVGSGTAVGPLLVHLGPVPALPLLAALPAGAGASGPMVALSALLGPLVAGILAGRLVQRSRPDLPPVRALAWGLAAGAGGGAVLGVLAAMSGGAAGPGRLAVVGPSPVAVAGSAALELGAVAALTAWRRARVSAAG